MMLLDESVKIGRDRDVIADRSFLVQLANRCDICQDDGDERALRDAEVVRRCCLGNLLLVLLIKSL